MDLRQLRYFIAIVECGSLGKAAERLFIAQPSLSQQIARIEAEMGVTVLVRSPQGVTPTAAGQVLYRHARLVLRQMDQLKQEVNADGGGEAGTVAVGVPTTLTALLTERVFDCVRRLHPGIHLQLFESMSGHISELLANGRLDLAILFREANTLGITAVPLFDETLFVFGESGCDTRGVDGTCRLASLANVPIVAPGVSNGLRLLIERTFTREEVPLNIVADVDSLRTLLAIAQSGAACTILPLSAIVSNQTSTTPRMRRIVEPEIMRPASLCWSSILPTNSATLAVRKIMLGLVDEMITSGELASVRRRMAA